MKTSMKVGIETAGMETAGMETKKLTLSRETLRQLDRTETRKLAAGALRFT
jgi:hypothetical protein